MDIHYVNKSRMQGNCLIGGALFKVGHIALDKEVLALIEAAKGTKKGGWEVSSCQKFDW
jgi:hypothetical protein